MLIPTDPCAPIRTKIAKTSRELQLAQRALASAGADITQLVALIGQLEARLNVLTEELAVCTSHIFFASKTGLTTNSGLSKLEPWPISYALSGAAGRVTPGSILNIDIEGVCPFELSPLDGVTGSRTPRTGFEVTLSGVPSARTKLNFTGQGIGSLPQYRKGITPNWDLVINEPGKQIWEGRHVINPASHIVGGYFLGTDGKVYPLTFGRHNNPASLAADTHIYRSDGAYYCGPTVMQQASGRPLIRLNPATSEAMLGKTTIAPPSLNPNECDLNLFVFNGMFLNVHGSHLRINGLAVSYSYIGVLLNPTAHHVEITNGSIHGGINLINCGAANFWSIDSMILDALMDPERGHLSWGDIKAGVQPADQNKATCINPGTGQGGRITRSQLRNAFDGLASGGPDMQVGGFAPRTPGMTIAQWDRACRKLGNHFDKIWDDAHQIDHAQRRLIHNHNLYTGAGLSRDGSAETTDFGSGRPLSLCNVFDGGKHKIFLYRKGRDAANSNQTGEGLRHPNTLAAHGPFVRPLSWIKVNDTELWGDDCVRAAQAKGLHGANGGLPQQEPNEKYNCIVIDRGKSDRTASVFFRPWSDFVLDSTTGLEIRDGNLVVNLAGAKNYQQRMKSSTGTAVPDTGVVPRARTVDELRRSQLFIDSTAYYSPGIDKKTDELFDMISPDNVIRPSSYVPHHEKAISGAVNITARGFPGCFAFRPWRGAIPPADQP
jgi:hypothetical protein